jgi:hypothetical protein
VNGTPEVRRALADIGAGMIGGYVGTLVLERVSMKLYELEPEEDRRREDEVRPGAPPIIAARKTARLLGLDLSEEAVERLGLYLFHYGLGVSWGHRLTPSCAARRTSRPCPPDSSWAPRCPSSWTRG